MTDSLRILVVEPWHGGSHEAFLDGWLRRSRHRIQVLGLPARHWKWRMEGAALTLAERAAELEPPDVLVTSDYLDLARFRGFLPPPGPRSPPWPTSTRTSSPTPARNRTATSASRT